MTDNFIGRSQFEAKTPVTVSATPSWTRLEPQSVTGDPRPGLEARVHDPLWLLCRQWQLGELEGDDAGSPLGVEVSVSSRPFSRWQAGDWDVAHPLPVLDLPAGTLVEPVVEDEAAAAGPGLRDRLTAGAVFLASVEQAGFEALRERILTHARVSDEPTADQLDRAWPSLVSLLAGRTVDAERLSAALHDAAGRPDGLPGWLTPAGADARRALGRVAADWRAWYAEIAPPPDPDTEAWVGDRLEYRFSVASRTATGEVVLRAPEFIGGEVDWYSFDLDDHPGAFGTPAGTQPPVVRTVSATPLRFAGMPSDRLWEFEDAAVNLGALQVEPHDLARLLLVEYAMTYGGDWLVVPIDVPFGSITTIGWVTYTTTFGERFLVRHPRNQRANDSWRMFCVTTSEGTALDALVVPPAVVSLAEGPAGTRSRVDEHTEPPPHQAGPVTTADLDYLLQTGVPGHWIPYLPRTTGYRSLELVQGRMRRFGGGEAGTPTPPDGLAVPPLGRLLNEPGRTPRCRARVSASSACPCSPDGWTAGTSAGRRVGSSWGRARGTAAWASTSPAPAVPPRDCRRDDDGTARRVRGAEHDRLVPRPPLHPVGSAASEQREPGRQRSASRRRQQQALSLCENSCVLPDRGWGRLNVSESSPRAGADWTNDGSPRELRGLKHRGQWETRSVPIPPQLV